MKFKAEVHYNHNPLFSRDEADCINFALIIKMVVYDHAFGVIMSYYKFVINTRQRRMHLRQALAINECACCGGKLQAARSPVLL